MTSGGTRPAWAKASRLTYYCLSATPTTPEILAAERRVAVRTVEIHLKRLAAFGLAGKSTDGWVAIQVSRQEMDRLATELGTLGLGERQQRGHEAERALFKQTYAGDPDGDGWQRWRAKRVVTKSKPKTGRD
jgi:hypothetical protein